MCADSVKCIVFNVLRLPDVIADTVAVEWMPGHCDGQVIEHILFVHNNFSGHDLFRRAAVNTNYNRFTRGFIICFQCTGSCADCCSKKIVSACVSDFRKSIIFSEKTNDWNFVRRWNVFPGWLDFSNIDVRIGPGRSKCSLDSSSIPFYLKSLCFQVIRKTFWRKFFFVSCFRMFEDIAWFLNKFISVVVKPVGDSRVCCGWCHKMPPVVFL